MARTGYVAIHRKIQDNFLWKEHREFSRAEAWIDMIMEAQHSEKPMSVMLKGVVLVCNYGESLKSISTWADRWNWTRSRVHRFFKLLKKQKMVEFKSEQVTTRLSICNYGTYDAKRYAGETQTKRTRNADETHANTDKNVKKEKNANKGKKFIPPTLEEINSYIKSTGYVVDGKKFFDYFNAGNWIDSTGKPVKNWKQKIITWSQGDKKAVAEKRCYFCKQVTKSDITMSVPNKTVYVTVCDKCYDKQKVRK